MSHHRSSIKKKYKIKKCVKASAKMFLWFNVKAICWPFPMLFANTPNHNTNRMLTVIPSLSEYTRQFNTIYRLTTTFLLHPSSARSLTWWYMLIHASFLLMCWYKECAYCAVCCFDTGCISGLTDTSVVFTLVGVSLSLSGDSLAALGQMLGLPSQSSFQLCPPPPNSPGDFSAPHLKWDWV